MTRRRFVVVVEYALDTEDAELPETTARIGDLVRRRLVEEPVPGAEHLATWGAMGRRAFEVLDEVLELMPPRH